MAEVVTTLRFGNLSPEAFAAAVGTQFTPEEIAALRACWSQQATLTGPNDWHVFHDPGISVTVGSTNSPMLEIAKAADARQPFQRKVDFELDEGWKEDLNG